MLPEIDELSFSREISSWKFYVIAVSRAGWSVFGYQAKSQDKTRYKIRNWQSVRILDFALDKIRKHLLLFVVPNVGRLRSREYDMY